MTQFNAKQVRDYLEGLPCPICTKDISDDQLQELIKDTDFSTKKMLRIDYIDLEDEEIDCMWFSELEGYAVLQYNMHYYEDFN